MKNSLSRLVRLSAFSAFLMLNTRLYSQTFSDTLSFEENPVQNEDRTRWPYSAAIAFEPPTPENANAVSPTKANASLVDFVLDSAVFSKAKWDLSDLRLFDSDGRAIPFAIRVLSPQKTQQPVSATEFDRDEPVHGTHQLTLDLLQNDIQHNEIKIETTGDNFRRRVEVEGSDDRSKWRKLASENIVRFTRDTQKLNLDTLSYPDSRYRFIRVSVFEDPGKISGDATTDDFRIREVSVLRQVNLPGEQISLNARVGPRQGIRSAGTAGSAWIIDLGGDNIPCDRIEVNVADKQFARDVSLQVEQPFGPLGKKMFSTIYGAYGTTWQRRPEDSASSMVATFPETRASRLRLQVTDYRNAPLTIRSIQFIASVRQVIFDRSALSTPEVRLYVGNPEAETPNYDFARNLPEVLVANPTRGKLLSMEVNPGFVPPPQAFLERFPWFIYAVLAAVTLALTIVIASLARSAITLHDTGWKQMDTQHKSVSSYTPHD